MNRIVSKSVQRLLLQNNATAKNRRMYSSESSGIRNKAIAAAGVATVLGSTLLYAKYDDSFRNQLNEYLPFMDALLGEDSKQPATPSMEESFLRKRQPTPASSLSSSGKLPDIAKQVPVPLEKPKEVAKPVEKAVEKPTEKAPKVEKTQQENKNVEAQSQSSDSFSEEEIKRQITASLQALMNNEEGAVQLGDKDHEGEIRAQLKRQLYVINDYFQEQIILYKTELNRRSEMELKDKLSSEKEAIAKDFEESFKTLKRMESLLKVRDSLDKQEKAMKHLYLLGQTLTNLLEHNRATLSHDTVPLKIGDEIVSIQKVINEHFPEETLIKLALDSLPENAKKNGVYSEEDLIRRFQKVALMANQVSLVGEEYSNLFDYVKSIAYSYVRPLQEYEFEMSLSPIQKKSISAEELSGNADVNPKEWDTYDIVKRVRLAIDNHNLEQALRYANQLKGEPRKIAQDWISDTRDHLEVKQTISLVQAKIAALGLQQINVINQ